METIVCAMASSDSGLDVRDRMWLKIRIPNAFIGSDVVHWLQSCVQGLHDRKDAKKFASKLLKQGFIQHTINLKNSFSEKCYYIFSELILHKVTQADSSEFNTAAHPGTNQRISSLEEGFSNALRLTNGNFSQDTGTVDQSNFGQMNQQFNMNSNAPTATLSGLNQTKPGLYIMPFMRYWDETSEIHNYGLFGPQQVTADTIPDGTASNHSGLLQ